VLVTTGLGEAQHAGRDHRRHRRLQPRAAPPSSMTRARTRPRSTWRSCR